jgi:16S rRNA (guanine527-N7)-methyltransferase
MISLSDTEIEKSLRPYQASLSPGMHEKIRTYMSLLLKWNRRISLTTVTDPMRILDFHFGESLFASSVMNFGESRLADVGSGAGFPGLPLAMTTRSLDVTLIESNAKKCAFLSEVTRELHLPNVTVFRGRMEDFPNGSGPFGRVAARALGDHGDLLSWARAHLATVGKVVLWIGNEDAQDLSRDSGWSWDKPVLIPGTKRRYLLVGTPRT